MPFTEEAGGVAGALEILREIERAWGDGAIVVDDAVTERVKAGEDGGAARGAERGGDERVFEVDAVASEGVEVWRLGYGVAHKAHRIEAMIIGEDKNNVLRLRAGYAFGDDAGGNWNNGGVECGARDDEPGNK